ncbi:histidine phosphatase family protein [Azospirillum sp. SYSU D00513]|uniref:histidine phosphatase family protein n=1 Tax=Azospirillum sp. SYSU D00513 TaxID=2812561 RepID=UPI001A970432|nr:histidine phosphatase family protein [Azospirillum sp. SYSU D00513]
MPRFARSLLAVLCLATTAGPALADDGAWAALREPGTAALMRHATAPGVGDPPGFRLEDCATQRNLNEAGRAEARATGAALRERGVQVDRVLTSRWCRALHTAEEMNVAPVAPEPVLDSFFGNWEDGKAQTESLRSLLAERAGSEKLVLVTHQVNITALTGVHPASGEIVVIAMGADGKPAIRGRIAPGR